MPCYQVRTISLKMDNMNLGVLEAALNRAGFQAISTFSGRLYFTTSSGDAFTYNHSTGSLSTQSTRFQALEKTRGAVAMAYAKEVVIQTAEANAWEWSENAQGQLEVTRGAW